MSFDRVLAARLLKAAIAREDAYKCPIVDAIKNLPNIDGGALVMHARRMRRRSGWTWPEIGMLANVNGERWTTSTWLGIQDLQTRDLGNEFSGEISWR